MIYNHESVDYKLPAQNSICMKWHDELDYLLPPYASIYPDITDIADYKALSKVAEEQANYKIIGFKIPRLDSDEPVPDNFAVQLTTATMFFNLIRSELSDTIGMFYSPMDFEEISFSSNQTNSRNKVCNHCVECCCCHRRCLKPWICLLCGRRVK